MLRNQPLLFLCITSILVGTESFSSPLFVRPQQAKSVTFPRLFLRPLFAEEKPSSGIASKSIWRSLDAAGMALKPKALAAKEKVSMHKKPQKKLRYSLLSCVYFSLFILYRAYRGFFVLLPEVFKQVYAKMEKTVESPFTDEDLAGADINPNTGRVRFRTAVTVSILSCIVTLSYILSGALRVLGSLIKSFTTTTSAASSFEAAANQMEKNESKILEFTNRRRVNGDSGLSP